MKASFINKIFNSQPILTKFALKLIVCKCLSFQTHLLLDLRFPLKLLFLLQKDIIQPVRNALDYYTQMQKAMEEDSKKKKDSSSERPKQNGLTNSVKEGISV